jgi:hypothetical protein
MCNLWSHAEENGNLTYEPYFAAVVAPWSVDVSFESNAQNDSTIVMAVITYTCPTGFVDCAVSPVATTVTATLSLPPALTLVAMVPPQKLVVSLRDLAAGGTVTQAWQVVSVDAYAAARPPSTITVDARGLVTASVPEYAGYFPAYTYSDWIGGTASRPY